VPLALYSGAATPLQNRKSIVYEQDGIENESKIPRTPFQKLLYHDKSLWLTNFRCSVILTIMTRKSQQMMKKA
jgi:hypothetical protein